NSIVPSTRSAAAMYTPREGGRPMAADHFVALSECHFMNEQSMHEMSYYPGFTRWWQSVDGVIRAWANRDLAGGAAMPPPRAHALIEWMDKAGVDVCFALRESMMDVSGY